MFWKPVGASAAYLRLKGGPTRLVSCIFLLSLFIVSIGCGGTPGSQAARQPPTASQPTERPAAPPSANSSDGAKLNITDCSYVQESRTLLLMIQAVPSGRIATFGDASGPTFDQLRVTYPDLSSENLFVSPAPMETSTSVKVTSLREMPTSVSLEEVAFALPIDVTLSADSLAALRGESARTPLFSATVMRTGELGSRQGMLLRISPARLPGSVTIGSVGSYTLKTGTTYLTDVGSELVTRGNAVLQTLSGTEVPGGHRGASPVRVTLGEVDLRVGGWLQAPLPADCLMVDSGS